MTKLTLAARAVLLAAILAPPAAAQDTRTITDQLGAVVAVPAEVERITVLDPLGALEALLSLGVAPTQVAQRSFVAEWTGDPLRQWPWLEARLTEIGADPLRMTADVTDLEQVALGAPDLIVGSDGWVAEVREQLEAIAPTVAVRGGDVRVSIRILGAALGMEEEAQAVLDAWDARIASELAGLAPSGTSVAIIRTDVVGIISVANAPGWGAYDFLAAAGFETEPEIADLPGLPGAYFADIPLERVDLLASSDLIVVMAFSPAETAALLDERLFSSLPAVVAGRLLVVEQGPIAQALAIQSPLNFDVILPVAQRAAELARR